MSRSALLLFATLAAAWLIAATACSDHDRLAVDPEAPGAGAAGGAGGTGGAAQTGTGTGGSGGIVEPPGPTKLTIVNGIVDYPAVRLCFVPYPDGPTNEAPWPGVQGLPFARGAVIDPIESEVAPDEDIEILVIAGFLSGTGGETCDSLMTAPPNGVEVTTLGVLPASVFTEQKSLLVVPSGCIGNNGHTDPEEELICGLGYSEAFGNATMVAGFMSRLGSTVKLPMQFAQASWGLSVESSVRVTPGVSGSLAQLIMNDWSIGAIAPFPPYDVLSTADLVSVDNTEISVFIPGLPDPVATQLLSSVFANSTLATADVSDGAGVVFIGLGASPEAASGTWWNDFTFTVVASDP